MFEILSSFFSYIKNMIEAVWSFFQSLLNGLITVFTSIPAAVSMVVNAIGYLPSTLIVFATLTITISVVYLVVGRETGG